MTLAATRFVVLLLVGATSVLPGCGRGSSPKSAAEPPATDADVQPPGEPAPAPGPASPLDVEGADQDEGAKKVGAAPGGGDGRPRGAPASTSPSLRRHVDARVTIAAVQARGLDETAVRGALEKSIGELEACHEKELALRPSLEGTADAELSFDAGLVANVRVGGLGDAALERCLEAVLARVRIEGATTGQGRTSAKVRLTLTRE